MGFEVNACLPGVWHIRDEMGVCMTLLAGASSTLLVDTGYGTRDVGAFVRTLTDKPLTVLLTHHHHDHALGARWFDKTYMLAADQGSFAHYTGREMRANVLKQVRAKGLAVEEAEFLSGNIAMPETLTPGKLDLGGMTAEILACPGHTPGSAVVYVPEQELLLTGDDWNPCTWLFFPEAVDVWTYREHLRRLLDLPFTRVLCPHQMDLYPREKLHMFAQGLTDEAIRAARPVSMPGWSHIATRQLDFADGQWLVFDGHKAGLD